MPFCHFLQAGTYVARFRNCGKCSWASKPPPSIKLCCTVQTTGTKTWKHGSKTDSPIRYQTRRPWANLHNYLKGAGKGLCLKLYKKAETQKLVDSFLSKKPINVRALPSLRKWKLDRPSIATSNSLDIFTKAYQGDAMVSLFLRLIPTKAPPKTSRQCPNSEL